MEGHKPVRITGEGRGEETKTDLSLSSVASASGRRPQPPPVLSFNSACRFLSYCCKIHMSAYGTKCIFGIATIKELR